MTHRHAMMALAFALAALSYGCTATTTATTRGELKAVQRPGEPRPSLEGSLLVECRWGGPAAK